MLPSGQALTQGPSLPFDATLEEERWHEGMRSREHQSFFIRFPRLVELPDSKDFWLCTMTML